MLTAIKDFPKYEITEDGRVWSDKRRKWLNPQEHTKLKYLQICLCKNNKKHIKQVHRLVLETFVGPCPDGCVCRHLDGDAQNNALENLCWGTCKENEQDKVKHGTRAKGESHGLSKLTDVKIKIIRYLKDVAHFSLSDIAWQFDVNKTTVSRICRKEAWSHV